MPEQEASTNSIIGFYENIIGVSHREPALRYWAELGYQPIAEGNLSANEAAQLYGVPKALTSIRLRNGQSERGFVRLMLWKGGLDKGLGLARPLSIGSRWMTSLTNDIVQLRDAYLQAITQGEKWIISETIRNIIGEGQLGEGFFKRFMGVREMMVLGEEVRHVYFQRYGYTVPHYGTVPDDSPLAVSEGTHSAVVVPDLSHLDFYSDVLGLKLEGVNTAEPAAPDKSREFNLPGTSPDISALMRKPGEIYHAATLVTPTATVGRIYVMAPGTPTEDLRMAARPGVAGLCLLTYKVSDITAYHARISASTATNVTPFIPNEFGETAFTFYSPDGMIWGIIG